MDGTSGGARRTTFEIDDVVLTPVFGVDESRRLSCVIVFRPMYVPYCKKEVGVTVVFLVQD